MSSKNKKYEIVNNPGLFPVGKFIKNDREQYSHLDAFYVLQQADNNEHREIPMPWLTFRDIREIITSGQYYKYYKSKHNSKLRVPSEFIKEVSPNNSLVSGLNYAEAEAFSSCLDGRLPTRQEADYFFCNHFGSVVTKPDGVFAVWTSSSYNDFDYDLLCFDRNKNKWVDAHNRKLPQWAQRGKTVFKVRGQGIIERMSVSEEDDIPYIYSMIVYTKNI